MAVKNTAQVIIGGKIITLGGYESEEYFQQVASYMNKKIGELETVPGYGRQPMETKHMLGIRHSGSCGCSCCSRLFVGKLLLEGLFQA